MPPYDSDSSGDEDDVEYTKTNVVLGFASDESADKADTISHLGGVPQWFDPATPPSATLARCKICKDIMVLLLQLNAELPDVFPGHERRLWVFECRRKACRRKEGSVRALRGVRIAKKEKKEKEKNTQAAKQEQEKPRENIGQSLFGAKNASNGAANPFSMGGGGANAFSNPFSSPTATASASSNPFAAAGLPTSSLAAKPAQQPLSSPTSELPKTFASALSLNNTTSPASSNTSQFGPAPPPEPWPSQADLTKPYPQYYLEDDIEYLDKLPMPDQAVVTESMDIDDEPNGSSSKGGGGGGKEDKEVYESSIDKTFQRFADRLSQNSEQVIRYEYKGMPLLYSKSDAVGKAFASGGSGEGKIKTTGGSGIQKCGNCGGKRVFEVQLTPHAIMELEREEEGFDGMEWGTVVVGVCERDCGVEGEVKYFEEWVGVQWEEMKG